MNINTNMNINEIILIVFLSNLMYVGLSRMAKSIYDIIIFREGINKNFFCGIVDLENAVQEAEENTKKMRKNMNSIRFFIDERNWFFNQRFDKHIENAKNGQN